MSRSTLIGCFSAITLLSSVAFAQAEGEAPAVAPAAARALPNPGADNPYADSTPPARPVVVKKNVAPKPAPAKTEPVKAAPPLTPPALRAQPPVHAQPPAPPPRIPPAPPPPPPPPPRPAPEPGHEHAAPADAHSGHGHEAASGHDSAASEGHGAAHHAESQEPPYIDDMNWFYGFLGESDEEEPSLLYRPKGTPTPFLATLINWGLLLWLIVAVAKKQVPAALAKRKAIIVEGMKEAQKLRDESAERLRGYEDKLASIDSDVERIKAEMAKAGEQERERILAEAVERRSRMERDARRLLETELEAMKESLRLEVVKGALGAAKKAIESEVAAPDQQRLFDEAMASLAKLPPRSLGGQA